MDLDVQGFTTGWFATASHQALDATNQICAIYSGQATPAAPATTAGVIACSE